MELDDVKKLSTGDSVKIKTNRHAYTYWAMVVWKDDNSITFATENFTKSTCKYKNYGKTWRII